MTTARPSRRRRQARWRHWQSTSVARRLLSPQDREAGYTVFQVPPPCRAAFLEVATVLLVYGRRVQSDWRPLAPAVQEAWEAWRQALRTLRETLAQEDPRDTG